MRHVGDGIGFDDGLALFIPPDLARMGRSTIVSDIGVSVRRARPSHCLTISLALPDGRCGRRCHARPTVSATGLCGERRAHEIAELARRTRR